MPIGPSNPYDNRYRPYYDGMYDYGQWNHVYPAQGWQCPVCGQVYAPTIPSCFKNHGKGFTITSNKVYLSINDIRDHYHIEEEEE